MSGLAKFQEAGSTANQEVCRARRAARVEDYEFLLAGGVAPEEAALRAGWPTVTAAYRTLYRHGLPHLARPLYQAAKEQGGAK